MAEVMRVASPYDNQSYFGDHMLHHSSTSSQYPADAHSYASSTASHSLLDDGSRASSVSDTSSASSSPPTYRSTAPNPSAPSSSKPGSDCLDRRKAFDDDIEFPAYNTSTYITSSDETRVPDDSSYPEATTSDDFPSFTFDSSTSSPGYNPVADDTAVRDTPSFQVDYLSHDWKEEDIWCSWRHIVSKRRQYGETSRLENASWRTWTKSKYQLQTVSPETLNWLKDCDVTWLYGPLQTAPSARSASESGSQLSKTNSFLHKKPILKKRNLSEVMLQKSLSASSLVKQAAASAQAQRDQTGAEYRPRISPVVCRLPSGALTPVNSAICPPEGSDSFSAIPSVSSSGLHSPDPSIRKHISFNEKVEQCIAVDFKQPEHDDEETPGWISPLEESSEDELMMRASTKKAISNTSSRRNSFTPETSKTIQILAPTTLKYHAENLEGTGGDKTPGWQPGRLASSASQETLRPTKPSANFLLDDDSDADMSWEPSSAFASSSSNRDGSTAAGETHNGMRRTASGMFMPFDEDEDSGLPANGILGRLVDTVNTAKDIAHVILNVGWRQ